MRYWYNPLDKKKGRYKISIRILNKLERAIYIYIGKYRENVFQCENIVNSNHCTSCTVQPTSLIVKEVCNNIRIVNN